MRSISTLKTVERMTVRLIALSLALLVTTLFVSSARAQRRGGFAAAPAGAPVGTSLSGGVAVRSHVVRLHRGRGIFAGSAFGPNYYPSYYPDYDLGDGSVEPPPTRIIVQAAPPASPAPPSKPPESLVMELRGDHWVRLTSYGPTEPVKPLKIAGQSPNPPGPQSGAQSGKRGASLALAQAPAAPNQTQPPPALPSAVLVFRDGHQEEAAKYTIVGTTIFIESDYWNSGSWTRKVSIAQLDLATTLKLNQERGAKFSLPSRPGEVMMRP